MLRFVSLFALAGAIIDVPELRDDPRGPGRRVKKSTCKSVLADLKHRHKVEHNATEPFTLKAGDSWHQEIHVPQISVVPSEGLIKLNVTVGMGSVWDYEDCVSSLGYGCWHGQFPSKDSETVHYITTIVLADECGNAFAVKELSPADYQDRSVVSFSEVFYITTALYQPHTITAYAYCNKHGLWASSPVKVTPSALAANHKVASVAPACLDEVPCNEVRCLESVEDEGATAEFKQTTADSVVAMLEFQQKLQFGNSRPTPIDDKRFPDIAHALHRPVAYTWSEEPFGKQYLTIEAGVGMYTRGIKAPDGCPYDCLHPQKPTDDPETVHYIDYAYAKDQDGRVVYLQKNCPVGYNEFVFELPAGVRFLTPYIHCNKHGLFVGQTIRIVPNEYDAPVEGPQIGCRYRNKMRATEE